jgi:hypothetical protein
MAELESWEGVKENIQPVSSGRDPNILSKFGSNAKNLAEEESFLQEKQREWENELEEALRHPGSKDLAAVWRNYWKWIQQHYPKGHSNSLEFLERATKSLSSHQRYKDNIHALKIWISYADSTRDPLPIFEYMYANDIGKNFSLFYEAYALVLEKNRKFAESDRMYVEGIHRKASPLERLEKRHQEFQHRMVRRMQREEEVQSLSKSEGRRNTTDRSIRQPLNALDRKPLLPEHKSTETPKQSKNFEIYQDEEQQENITPKLYPHMPRMTEVAKENQGKVDIWKGRRLPQSGSLNASSSSVAGNSFEIFEDDAAEKENIVETSAKQKPNMRTPFAPREAKNFTSRRETGETKAIKKSPQSQGSRISTNFNVDKETSNFEGKVYSGNREGTGAEGKASQVFGQPLETKSEVGNENQNDDLSDNDEITCDNTLNVSSPTIHTKMALADVEAMFDSTLTFDRNLRLLKENAIPDEDNDTFSFAATTSCPSTKNNKEDFFIYEDPE